MYLDTIFSKGFVTMFLTTLLYLRIQDTKIHIPYLEIICIYVCRIKESAELCIQFCILTVSRRFCTIRLLMARKRVSAFCTLLIRVVRVQVTALCERAINTLHAWGLCLTLCTQHRKSAVSSRVGESISLSRNHSVEAGMDTAHQHQHAWGLKAGNRTGLVHQRNPPKSKARTYRSPQPCWVSSQHSRMLDVYIFLAFLYTYALTCIQNNQIELNNLLYNPAHD